MPDDTEPQDEQLDAAYDLMDELWPEVKKRWPIDPVGRLRHVIVANLEHAGPKPTPTPPPPGPRREVQPRFKKGNK